MAPVQPQQTSVKTEGPEMGSFDELITPFLMDSTENFEFEENAAGSNVGDGVQLSFDGLGTMEDFGLFTQSNLEAMSEHSLIGAAAPLALAQFGPLADGSLSIQKRLKVPDAIDIRQLQAPVEQPTRSAAPAEVCPEESTRGRSRRARKRTRKAFETQEQDEEQAGSLQQPPASLDRAAHQREQMQSQRRKQMYVDYLKQHVGGGTLDHSTASGRQRSTNLGAASSRAKDDDDATANFDARGTAAENGVSGTKTQSRRKRQAKDVSGEDSKQTTRGSARRVRGSTTVKDADEAWTADAEPAEQNALLLQRAIVVQFLKYRTSNVLDRDRWCDILDENVELVLPREPYRVSHGAPGEHNMQRVSGVDGVVRDTRSMTALVEMIRTRSRWIKQLDIRARVAAHTTQLARHAPVPAGGGDSVNNAEAALNLSSGDASKKPFSSHSCGDTATQRGTDVPASPPNSGRHDNIAREHKRQDEPGRVHSPPPSPLPELQQQAFGQHGAEHDLRRQVTAIAEQAPRAEAFAKIGVQYVVDAHEMLVADRLLMCSWTLQTVGLVDVGFATEVAVEGMLKARFTEGETRKLEKLSLSFDCMALMQQLNTHGLLDMPAVAAAASEASRNAAIARSPVPAAPARPVSSAASLVNNPSVLAGLAAAFPALATSLAAAAQATPGDVVSRARLLLSKFQAAQQASSAAAASVQRASLGDSPVANRRADGDAATSGQSTTCNSASAAPLPTSISQASPATGTQVVNASEMARSPAMGQCLRALVAASSAKSGAPAGITSTNSGGGNTPTAAAAPALAQPLQQQQLLTQCMPYLANYYSLHMALLRQQQAKAAAAATAAGLNTPQQQPQQVNVQRLQQLVQQQQAQLAHSHTLAHHQQLTHAHSHFSQQLPQQVAKQSAQPQMTVQSSAGQQLAPGAAPHHQEREHEALQRPEETQIPAQLSAQNEPHVAQQHAPISSGESLSSPAGAQHSIPSPSIPVASDGAAHAASYATQRTTTATTANTSTESTTATPPVGTQGLIQHGPQPGLSIPSSIPTNPVANALLGKYMATAGSTPVMQFMANYMAMNQRQRQALQHAAATTPHIPAQQGRQ